MSIAFITGITGQDGYFLTKLLLVKGYKVFGFSRDYPVKTLNSLSNDLLKEVTQLKGSIENPQEVIKALELARPNEIYHLASQSHPGKSWQAIEESLKINGLGAVNLFEAVRQVCPTAKVHHASSAEIFGRSQAAILNEQTPMSPSSPYAASKAYAHHLASIYRASYGLFISNGILFNHESERRSLSFVTQKVAYGAACAALGIIDSFHTNEAGEPIVRAGKLALGNLDVSRDWGYAPDFVKAMWLMLQQSDPNDFVIGTGKAHSLRELCEIAYGCVDKHWQDYVYCDKRFKRPLETNVLIADAGKAESLLGWRPSIDFRTMIMKMVRVQIEKLRTSQA
ncbi:MAG: GDP-mannose 4,6-dehydratase [Legionella sp.]|nr:GDP-mannose 4,6-dehydratase [Legionella sp.]